MLFVSVCWSFAEESAAFCDIFTPVFPEKLFNKMWKPHECCYLAPWTDLLVQTLDLDYSKIG